MIDIGVVKIDVNAKERSLSTKYHALDNPENLRILLGDYHALKGRRFNGDTAASDILIDLQTAIDKAGLTDRQRQALQLIYGEDLTHEESGKRMGGISKQAIDIYTSTAIEKVTEVYFYWCGHGEGYTRGDASIGL